MKKRILLTLVLLSFLSPAYSIQVEDLEWQSRPLLIFAPDMLNSHWLSTRRQLNQHSCDLEDRNIILGKFYYRGESTLAGQLISEEYKLTLYEQYQVAQQDFMVILIGKDGREKYRIHEAPDLEMLFSLIDKLPMRRIETRQQPSPCISSVQK